MRKRERERKEGGKEHRSTDHLKHDSVCYERARRGKSTDTERKSVVAWAWAMGWVRERQGLTTKKWQDQGGVGEMMKCSQIKLGLWLHNCKYAEI